MKNFLLLKENLEILKKSESSLDCENKNQISNDLTDGQKQLLLKCIKYINHGRLITNTNENISSPSSTSPTSLYSSAAILSSPSTTNFQTVIPNINVIIQLLLSLSGLFRLVFFKGC
jgi:hypothetical protein